MSTEDVGGVNCGEDWTRKQRRSGIIFPDYDWTRRNFVGCLDYHSLGFVSFMLELLTR